MRPQILLTLLGLITSVASAATTPCTPVEVTQARTAFKKEFDRKDYVNALEKLTHLEENCELPEDTTNFWIKNDKALALMKSGKPRECLQLLAPLTYPSNRSGLSSLGLELSPVGKATDFNMEQCRQALELKLGPFQSEACRPGETSQNTTDLASLVMRHGEKGCVVVGQNAKEERSGSGSVFFIGNKGQKLRLMAEEGPLAEGDVCHIEKLSFQLSGKRRLLRFEGCGRDCNGGTASTCSDAIYEWKGRKLILDQDNSIGYH